MTDTFLREAQVSIKKTKDVRFTFQDAAGCLRAVTIQVQHHRDDGLDRIAVIATSEGVPIEASARITLAAGNKVKTKSRY